MFTFFLCDELKFYSKVVELVNKVDFFNKEEHVFITPFKNVYQALKDVSNIVYIETGGMKKASTINACSKQCDWIFVHFMCSPLETMKIKKAPEKKSFGAVGACYIYTSLYRGCNCRTYKLLFYFWTNGFIAGSVTKFKQERATIC